MAREEQCRHFFGDTEKGIGFSQTVRADNILYISGVLAVDDTLEIASPDDMGAQITQAYKLITDILAESGATLKDVVKETIFATDLAALGGAFEHRKAAYAGADAYVPACTMVQVSGLFLPGAMVEIELVAHL